MKLPIALVDWLRRRLLSEADRRSPDFVIGAPGNDYLRRWFIIPRNRLFNIYLHQFMRSDDDRALHDHPWWNVSILLDGEYIEHTICAGGVNRRQRFVAGDLKFRTAISAHRIELPVAVDDAGYPDIPCWTLFITGPRIRNWGFHCSAGWRPWQEFTKPDASGEIGRGCD